MRTTLETMALTLMVMLVTAPAVLARPYEGDPSRVVGLGDPGSGATALEASGSTGVSVVWLMVAVALTALVGTALGYAWKSVRVRAVYG